MTPPPLVPSDHCLRWPLRIPSGHFVLDLQRQEDYAVAATLCLWAADVPGENLVNCCVDGAPAPALTRARSYTQGRSGSPIDGLPKEGILELDYVVVAPLERLPPPPQQLHDRSALAATDETNGELDVGGGGDALGGGYWRADLYRLRAEDDHEWLVAQRLAQLAYEYANDPWLPAVLPLPRAAGAAMEEEDHLAQAEEGHAEEDGKDGAGPGGTEQEEGGEEDVDEHVESQSEQD